jgi:hypothetical protein
MLHRFLFFALIAWFNAPLALAQGEDDARERFILGQKAYQEGDYDRAIAEWKAAYELDARSRILYNLSQAYERAGRLAEAVESLDEFLARIDDGDPVRETAIARLAAMRERLRRTGLQILDAPAGAEIFVNGESWGRAPRPDPIAVAPGSHKVELRLEGYREFRAQVLVPAGETVDVAVEMAPRGKSPMPLVVAGSGAGLVVAALVVGGIGLGKASDAPYSSGGQADTAKRMAISADVMGVVGGAALIGGGIWWLVQRRSQSKGDADAASVSVFPVLSRDTVGLEAAIGF